MRIIVLGLLAAVGFSQTEEDVASLIQEVADASRTTANWQIEGTISYPKPRADHTPSEQFSLLMRSPGETRFEQMGMSAPVIIVCDGANTWVYSPALQRYRKEPSVDDKFCSPIVGDWKLLPTSLQSPVFAGTCGPDPLTRTPDYKLVRGFSEPELPSVGRITRTLCIAPDHKLVVWEKWESRYSTRIYTYHRPDSTAQFGPAAFTFDPPRDSAPTDFELPTPRPLGSRGMSAGVSPPRLVAKKEPSYGEASRQARIEGTVVLYVVISPDGKPEDVLVYRHLSPDLDAEAVRTVRQWRFTSGMSNGQPVAVPVLIEVNFQLR